MASQPGTKKKEVVRQKSSVSESGGGGCCICCEDLSIFAVGACDHPICYKCSARMRVLAKQTYCPTCRAEMKQVVVSFQLRKFADFNIKAMKGRDKFSGKFLFEEWRVCEAVEALFDNICIECGFKEKPFRNFEDLRTHIRRVHEKQFCQICLDALNIFPYELKTYTKKELVQHRKEGDSDDKSHRGHPECKFCSDRFVDNDTLLLHLRKSHFWCHFCEHDGKQEYYNIYKDLRQHFGEMHYLCDEGDCRNEKFTSVWREQIDYQAHKLARHGKNFSKTQAKEARKIELDYSYGNNRQQQPRATVVTGADYAEVQQADTKQGGGRGGGGRGGKGESGGARGGRDRKREDQKLMDFSNFEDVEKEREDLREKRLLEKMKKAEEKGTGMSASGTKSRTQNSPVAFSEDVSPPEYRDVRLNHRGEWRNNDDDVIGMPELINRSDAEQNVNMIKEKPKPKQKAESSPKLKKVETPTPQPPQKQQQQQQYQPQPQSIKKSDDFPLLPGATPVHVTTTKSKPQEDFPALGKSVRPKDQQQQPGQPKQPISHVAGIPVTVKKPKEKGKSWAQQRANVNMNDEFPSLSSNVESTTKQATSVQGNKSSSGNKTSQTSTWQTDRKPPGLSMQVNGTHGTAPKNKPAAHTGRGPPGLGAAGNRDSTAPGVPPGLVASPENFPSPSPAPATINAAQDNIRERNVRLWSLLQTYLDTFNLQIFKSVSGDFRKDVVSASEYYKTISELLGDNLKYVFSELVALLPDECESKRVDLLQLNRDAKLKEKEKENTIVISTAVPKRTVWGANATNPLQQSANKKAVDEAWCPDCGVSFPRDEIEKHMGTHGEAFPSLPTAKKKPSFPMPVSKKVYQSQARNAWTK